MGKNRKKIWLTTPPCLFWTLWRKRNRVVFENEISSVQRIRATFLSNLWYWANLYSFDNMNSLVDFFYLGWGIDNKKILYVHRQQQEGYIWKTSAAVRTCPAICSTLKMSSKL